MDEPALLASSRRSSNGLAGPGGPRRNAVELILYGSLLGLAVVGLLSPGRYNLLPAETILEGVLILTTGLLMSRVDACARSILLIALGYLSVKVALMALGGTDRWVDFFQAYKAFFYLLGFAFFVNRRCFDGRRLAKVSAILVVAFFIKYSYSLFYGVAVPLSHFATPSPGTVAANSSETLDEVGFGLDARPGIYHENNFELVMLLMMFYLGFPYAGRWRNAIFVVLIATVLISSSRSGALGLVLVYIGLCVRLSNRLWPLHLFGLGAVGYAVYALFARRDTLGLTGIDRYRFLQTFLAEVQRWPLWEFVTGSYPITPLSPGSCTTLSFYKDLFSYSDPGVCYSVILHSYLLRAIFDHGLLGLILLWVMLAMALSRSGARRRDIVVLLGILLISGLSVSAFNSVFSGIGIAIALGLNRARGGGTPLAAVRTSESVHRRREGSEPP